MLVDGSGAKVGVSPSGVGSRVPCGAYAAATAGFALTMPRPPRICGIPSVAIGWPVTDLARMIGFDLERPVPFPPEQTRFDWVALPDHAEEPRRVLVVAAEARTVERALALVAGARRQPAALTVACHALPALL